jgi:hypothetical protein
VQSLQELRDNPALWQRGAACELAPQQGKLAARFAVPVVAAAVQLEFVSFHVGLQVGGAGREVGWAGLEVGGAGREAGRRGGGWVAAGWQLVDRARAERMPARLHAGGMLASACWHAGMLACWHAAACFLPPEACVELHRRLTATSRALPPRPTHPPTHAQEASQEALQCPRCSQVITERHGICR